MARRPARRQLDVFLNARLVGRLQRRGDGAIEFRYDDRWLADPSAIPISLSLPLREDRYAGDPVVAVFENLLPDSVATRRQIAARFQAPGHDAFSLLATIGHDCVGALQFLPAGAAPDPAGPIESRSVSEAEIAMILAELPSRPLGLDLEPEFRISLAGTQDKTALLRHQGQWHLPLRTTATTHILKPQIGRLANGIDLSRSVEIEYLTLRLTAALGLPCARAEIADFAGRRALVVERFDRTWSDDGRLLRVPQEDLCQALGAPPTRKYEAAGGPGVRAIMSLLQASDDPAADRRLFFATQFAFWLLAATDGHAKNFSLFLRPGGRFRLAPLYDVISAQPCADAGQIRRHQLKLAMALGDGRHYVVRTVAGRHFLQTATACGLDQATARAIIEEIASRVAPAIDLVIASLPPGFPADLTDSVVKGLRDRSERAVAIWP